MNIQQIEAFLEICKERSFTNAASRLYITQSTLNYRIHSLENELGAKLFTSRKGVQNVELTQAGEAFIPRANKLVRLWEETLNSLSHKYSDTFCVAMSQSILRSLGNKICAQFLKRELDVCLSLDSFKKMDILSKIKDGSIDIALLSGSYSYSGVKIQPIATEKMVVLCNKESKFDGFVKRSELDVSKELVFDWSGEFTEWINHIESEKRDHHLKTSSALGLETLIQFPDVWSYAPVSFAHMASRLYGAKMCMTDIEPPDRIIWLAYGFTPKQPYTDMLTEDIKTVLRELNGISIL